MRYILLVGFFLFMLVPIAMGEYIERVDGGGIIGEVTVSSDKINISDWDGKKYSFYRDYIRRIRSQETGKFETYTSKGSFEIYTDAKAEFANQLAADLDFFQEYMTKAFGFKKPPKERITVRVFSSTRDYENHWDNRHKAAPQKSKLLAFYDAAFKDVSTVYAGRDTFRIIAPRVAMVFMMSLYPKTFQGQAQWLVTGAMPSTAEPRPAWLILGWYGLFENVRIENGEIDMLGLDIDSLEDVQKFFENKPFSLELLFSTKYEPGKQIEKKDYDIFKKQATVFMHYLAASKKIGTKVGSFLDRIEEYVDAKDAFIEKIDKKVDSFENDLRKWIQSFSDESPWRIYNSAEREFLRKKNSKCIDLLDAGIKKYPNFENFLKLRAMTNITIKDNEAALDDVKKLEVNPNNAEMCSYFRGLIYVRQDELRKAAQVFRDLIIKDPAYYRCYEQLLNIYWIQETTIVTNDEADSSVNVLKEYEPFSYTYILEAKVLMKQEKFEDARVPLLKAQRRDEGNPEIEELIKLRRKMAQNANK